MGNDMTRKTKRSASRAHDSASIESFRDDPIFASQYLGAVLNDGD